MKDVNGNKPVWSILCLVKHVFWAKADGHLSHLCGLSPILDKYLNKNFMKFA